MVFDPSVGTPKGLNDGDYIGFDCSDAVGKWLGMNSKSEEEKVAEMTGLAAKSDTKGLQSVCKLVLYTRYK